MQFVFGPEKQAFQFNYFKDGSPEYAAHQDPFVVDLNADGIDEVIFGGLETQPNTPENFSDLSLTVGGWQNGEFKDLTSQYLPGENADISGVGQIVPGDYDADGDVDIFLSAYADMDHVFSAYWLRNDGQSFSKIDLGTRAAWQHGAATADINNDGYADVLAVGYGAGDEVIPDGYSDGPAVYLGSEAGLILKQMETWQGFGSGVALADFLGNGSTTAVISDAFILAGSDGRAQDTVLASINVEAESVSLERISSLPTPSLEFDQGAPNGSHDVRVLALEFSGDNLTDVVILSRADNVDGIWPLVSTMQFLRNEGEGVFSDVTATFVGGFDTETGIAYHPIVKDLDGNGLVDIFNSAFEYGNDKQYSSTSILSQEEIGKWVNVGRTELSALTPENSTMSAIAEGPDEQTYLIHLNKTYGSPSLVSTRVIQVFQNLESGSYTLEVILNLTNSPVFLDGLIETVTESAHTIEYQGNTYDYSAVQDLITTVSRDGEFTSEFAAEIAESFPDSAGISYSTAVALIGQANMESTLLMVAGADGNYVG